MRQNICIAILLTLLAPYGAKSQVQTQPEFSIAITGPREPIKSGGEVKVNVELKNISGQDTLVAVFGRDTIAHARPLVSAASGDPVPEAKPSDGRRMTSHNVIDSVKAGETLHGSVSVTDFYDLREPGTYKIQIEYFDWDTGATLAKSNIVSVVIEL